MTTARRFAEVVGSVPRPGEWYHLEIEPSRGQPGLPTWHAQLELDGYRRHSRGMTVGGYRLAVEDGSSPRPRDLSSAVVPRRKLPVPLAEVCRVATFPGEPFDVTALLSGVDVPASVVVRDVGQASFISLLDGEGAAMLHFDVGFPTSFNGHTAPARFEHDPDERPLIVLSHWDWDHLHAALALPHLMCCTWIVPPQELGPGAARVARILDERNKLFLWPASLVPIEFNGNLAMRCLGPLDDRNANGLALSTRLESGRTCLLTGDADYRWLPPGYLDMGPIDDLVATHHGARIESDVMQVPRPTWGDGRLILSYGRGNVYRHPHDEALRLHSDAGWTRLETTAGRKGVARRGDRCLR